MLGDQGEEIQLILTLILCVTLLWQQQTGFAVKSKSSAKQINSLPKTESELHLS